MHVRTSVGRHQPARPHARDALSSSKRCKRWIRIRECREGRSDARGKRRGLRLFESRNWILTRSGHGWPRTPWTWAHPQSRAVSSVTIRGSFCETLAHASTLYDALTRHDGMFVVGEIARERAKMRRRLCRLHMCTDGVSACAMTHPADAPRPADATSPRKSPLG
jgi:hypothetical protein